MSVVACLWCANQIGFLLEIHKGRSRVNSLSFSVYLLLLLLFSSDTTAVTIWFIKPSKVQYHINYSFWYNEIYVFLQTISYCSLNYWKQNLFKISFSVEISYIHVYLANAMVILYQRYHTLYIVVFEQKMNKFLTTVLHALHTNYTAMEFIV